MKWIAAKLHGADEAYESGNWRAAKTKPDTSGRTCALINMEALASTAGPVVGRFNSLEEAKARAEEIDAE